MQDTIDIMGNLDQVSPEMKEEFLKEQGLYEINGEYKQASELTNEELRILLLGNGIDIKYDGSWLLECAHIKMRTGRGGAENLLKEFNKPIKQHFLLSDFSQLDYRSTYDIKSFSLEGLLEAYKKYISK